MPGRHKSGGNFRNIIGGHHKAAGTWRKVITGYKKEAGTWIKIYGSASDDSENFIQKLADWSNGTVPDADIVNYDTTNVLDFSNLVTRATAVGGNNTNLKAFNLSVAGWNTAKATTMEGMFRDMTLFNQDCSNFVTTSVTDMGSMFRGCTAFNGSIAGWDTSANTSVVAMFENCAAFNQPVDHLDVSGCWNFYNMFSGCTIFNQPMSSWTTTSMQRTEGMFRNAVAFDQNISNFDMSKVYQTSFMFSGASVYNNGNQSLSTWVLDELVSANNMFDGARAFNNGGSSLTWSLPKTTTVNGMFAQCDTFNVPLAWTNTQVIANWGGLFRSTKAFNQNLNSIDVTGATTFGSMFSYAEAFNNGGAALTFGNQPTALNSVESMFEYTKVYNQSVKFNTSNVTIFKRMFRASEAFNQATLSTMNVGSGTDFTGMFQSNTVFNRGLSCWNTSSATTMDAMFSGAAFNQSIDMWIVPNIPSEPLSFGLATGLQPSWGVAGTFTTGLRSASAWGLYDPRDMSTLFQDTAGTTPVTAVGQNVKYIRDISGNGFHLAWKGGTSQYQEDSTGQGYIKFRSSSEFFPSDGAGGYSNWAASWGLVSVSPGFGVIKDAERTTSRGFPTGGNFYAGDWFAGPFAIVASGDHDSVSGAECVSYNDITVTSARGMFSNLKLDYSVNDYNWSAVTDVTRCFENATNWNNGGEPLVLDLPLVTQATYMFYRCRAFNQSINNVKLTKGSVGVSGPSIDRMIYDGDEFNNGGEPLDFECFGRGVGAIFYNCAKLNVPITRLSFPNAVDMNKMFYGCTIFNQPLPDGFVHDKVTRTDGMFDTCRAFNQPLTNWDTSNVTQTRDMFSDCDVFNQDVSHLNLEKVTHWQSMFKFCRVFNSGAAAGVEGPSLPWTGAAAQYMTGVFDGCTVFNCPLPNMTLGAVETTSQMFYNCFAFDQDISKFNLSVNKSMGSMMRECRSWTNKGVDIDWDLPELGGNNFMDATNIFEGCDVVNINFRLRITSKVTSLDSVFRNLGELGADKSIIIDDVSGVTDFDYMFLTTSKWSGKGNLNTWDVSSGVYFRQMFENCLALDPTDIDLSSWSTGVGAVANNFMNNVPNVGSIGQPTFN